MAEYGKSLKDFQDKINANKKVLKTYSTVSANQVVTNQENRNPCPHCGEAVMATAKICPFCNNPIFSFDPNKNAAQHLVAFVITFAALSLGITMCANWEMENVIMPSAERQTERLMREAEKDVEAMMRRLSN